MFEAIQPYVGARPFEARDQNLFFGRDAEAVELVSRIVSHSDVLLYAQSGAGKTSLINARLVPLLQKEGYEVLAGARVQGPAPAIELSSISNLYMFQALARLAGSRFEPSHLAGMSLQSYLGQSPRIPDAEGGVRPRVLVIDQFEELFTFYPERWPERRRFFEQLRDALNADRALHVLLSMREDYVAETEPYAAILPQKLRTRFRLERLREKPAVDAVAEPLRLTDRAFQNGVAASLVTDLLEIRVKSPDGAIVKAPGEFVEPVHLQVACERIWKSLKPGEKVITYKMLAASGDVDAALQEFYERAIASALSAAPGLKEATLRQFFERDLITAAGTRGTVYRGGTETCGIPNEAIDALDKEHIVRPEFRGGAQWYELTHDRLIEPIRKSGQSWLNKGKRQGLEDRAKAWSDGGRGSAGLLTEAELQDYRKWLESPEALSLGHTRTVDEFLEASRKALDAEDTILRLAWDRFRSYDLGAVRSQLRYRTLRYVILLLAAAVLGAAFAYVEFSHYNHLWLPSLHIAIVAAAVAIPVIQALASVRRDENKWRMLRVAAESVKREIYRYRTRVGIYGETESRNASRSAKLATALESISSTLAPSETILSVASSASPGDLNALTGMEYLASRVQAQIQYFTSKIRLVNQRQLTLQMAAFTFAAAGVFFAALSLDLWVVGSFIIYLALLALQEMQPVESDLVRLNQSLTALSNLRDWWEALSLQEKADQHNLEFLVEFAESTLEGELIDWTARTQRKISELRQPAKSASAVEA